MLDGLGVFIQRSTPVRYLYLVLTAQCNLRCAYCYENAKRDLRMPWDVLKAGMDLASVERTLCTDVFFSGGEPLLEFGLIRRAVRYARKIDPQKTHFRYTLLTNGLLLSREISDFLEEHGFRVQISFDGVPAAQDYRGKGTFLKLDRRLDSLRLGHPQLFRDRLRVAVTVVPPTIPYMSESARYLIEKGVREIVMAPGLIPYSDWKTQTINELARQFEQIANFSRRTLEETGEVPVTAFRRYFDERTGTKQWQPGCDAIAGGNWVVDSDGQVYSCPMFARSYQTFPPGSLMRRLNMLTLGDVRDPEMPRRCAALPEAVRTSRLMEYRTNLRSSYGECNDCEYQDRCGICPFSVWYAAGEAGPFRVPDFICAFNRTALDARDRFPHLPVRQLNTSADKTGDPIEPLKRYLRSIGSYSG